MAQLQCLYVVPDLPLKTTTEDPLGDRKTGDYEDIEDYEYSYDYSGDYDYYNKEVDCSIYRRNITKIREIENKKCTDFADEGFRCIPYYACREGEIITNGSG